MVEVKKIRILAECHGGYGPITPYLLAECHGGYGSISGRYEGGVTTFCDE